MHKEWTEARFNSFIKSALRAASQRWPPRNKCLNDAFTCSKVNSKSGRMAKHYLCAACGGEFVRKDVEINHKQSVVPPEGFTTWDEVIERMFVEEDGFEVLCKPCHKEVTSKERSISKETKSTRILYPREESVYRNMVSRCHNPKSTGYKHYGGRGITVCERWRESFYNFLEDMGPRPENTTLDRIDNDKGYYKENCRWADSVTQATNRSHNTWIEYDGELHTISQWSEKLGIKQNTITYRILRGWPIGQALEIEPRPEKEYNGRLSEEDIEYLLEEINSGRTQTSLGKELGIDASQVNRIYHRFKTIVERQQAKERRDNAKR